MESHLMPRERRVGFLDGCTYGTVEEADVATSFHKTRSGVMIGNCLYYYHWPRGQKQLLGNDVSK